MKQLYVLYMREYLNVNHNILFAKYVCIHMYIYLFLLYKYFMYIVESYKNK